MKISSETVHQALDGVLKGITLTEWERQRILRPVKKPVRVSHSRFFRHVCAAAATCVLAVAFATGVLAAVPGLAEKLSMLNRETLAFFTPIEKETTAADIRVEVVAAMNDGDTAIIYVALQDMSGQKRLDSSTALHDIELDGIPDMMCDNAYSKPDGTVILRLIGTSDRDTLSGKKVTMRLHNILSQNTSTVQQDTGRTVADIQRENPEPPLGNSIAADSYTLNGSLDGPLYQVLESENLKTLKAGEPYVQDGLPWLKVLGVGVIDHTLHVLTDPDNDKWYNYAQYFLADENGEAYPTETATVDLDSSVQPTPKGHSTFPDRQEQLLQLPENVSPEEMHLCYSADEYAVCITGDWSVTFTLQQATASISAACKLNMQPWTANSVDVSPIGVTINGTGSMTENSLCPEVSIYLKDGTVLKDYGTSITTVLSGDDGAEDKIQMKSFLDEPIDTALVERITVNGDTVWSREEAA